MRRGKLRPSNPAPRSERIRGRGLFREHWFSICSRHRYFDSGCKLCQHGLWMNIWRHRFCYLVFKLAPRFWQWWANR